MCLASVIELAEGISLEITPILIVWRDLHGTVPLHNLISVPCLFVETDISPTHLMC